MHIESIPMWTGKGNNYAYLVSDDQTKDATIIDPANPPEVLPVLKKRTEEGAINLQSIINTHHHHDHSGGNAETLKTYPLPLLAGPQSPHVTRTPAHNSTFTLGSIHITALHTPCHTQDSICYLFADGDTGERAVFTGDTLFTGGCGRFFEGTPAEMRRALCQVLGGLEGGTRVFPGHEYTAGNAKFGLSVLPSSSALQKLRDYAAANSQTQGAFTIADEWAHNVFMRLDDPDVQTATGVTDPVAVMGKLREMKNGM